MVGMLALGIGAQAIGGLFSGRAKKKAAKKMLAKVEKAADQGIAALTEDQQRAIQYRADDEARLKAATGYDLVKLRDDAVKAGFNPLTVLNATGAAGYDGRGAVLTTPFISRADGFFQKAGLLSGTPTQAMVDSSGYVGDAISGIGSNIIGVGQADLQRQHELRMQQIAMGGSPGAIAGSRVTGGRPGSSAPLVGARTITASPIGGPAVAKVGDIVATYPGRATEIADHQDVPATQSVEFPDGHRIETMNPAVWTSEPAQWLNDMWLFSAGVVGPAMVRAQQWYGGRVMANEARQSAVEHGRATTDYNRRLARPKGPLVMPGNWPPSGRQ